MVTRDTYGTVVNLNDIVSFALGTSVAVPAKIEQLQTLVPGQPPVAVLLVQVVVPIQTNGVIPGITALPKPKEESKLISA